MLGRILIISVLGCSLLALTGCGGSNHQDLLDYIAETKRRPKGVIEPLPTFRPYKAFTYSAMAIRSPFDPPVKELERALVASGETVKPDFAREKEYLEGINFNSLTMVGTLAKDGVLWALIDDGVGGVHRIRPGNFLGKNHGKVVLTTRSQVDVIEIVSDGLQGWLERPRSLKLEEKE